MIDVCAAVIVRTPGLVLVARRTRPEDLRGLWEFPGGKLEPGEVPAQCLVREIEEELSFKIEVRGPLAVSFRGQEGAASLRLSSYAARPVFADAEPRLTDGTHDLFRWVTAAELSGLDWAPLDVPHLPAVTALLQDRPC